MRSVVWYLNHVGRPVGEQGVTKHLKIRMKGTADNFIPHCMNSRHRAILLATMSANLGGQQPSSAQSATSCPRTWIPDNSIGQPCGCDLFSEGIVSISLYSYPIVMDLWPRNSSTKAVVVHEHGNARAIVSLHHILSICVLGLPQRCQGA